MDDSLKPYSVSPPKVVSPACVCLVLLIGNIATPTYAADDNTSLVRRTLEDTRLYVTAPLRWDATDWSYVGGAVAMVAAAHEFDDKVRTHFAGDRPIVLDGKDPHSTRDALPAAAIVVGTWAYAALLRDSSGYAEGWSMLEAAGLSSVSAYALKLVAGRERPNESTQPDSWGKGGSSFPSLHATAAFAIGTVLAESGDDSNRWLRRGLGYGIAAGTAYRRLDGNVHWLSDTVAGAAIGISTAGFVMNRGEHHRLSGRFEVMPLEHGALLTWTMPLQ
jgi:membrane-associated phospholipid phosphatase